MRELLLCPPDYYGIEYEINPWMSRARGAEAALAHVGSCRPTTKEALHGPARWLDDRERFTRRARLGEQFGHRVELPLSLVLGRRREAKADGNAIDGNLEPTMPWCPAADAHAAADQDRVQADAGESGRGSNEMVGLRVP